MAKPGTGIRLANLEHQPQWVCRGGYIASPQSGYWALENSERAFAARSQAFAEVAAVGPGEGEGGGAEGGKCYQRSIL